MAKTRRRTKQVEDYRHDAATRVNNPTAALAREDVEAPPARKLAYDPHLPPELWWAGKDHDAEFEVEAPSIHIHERLSAEAIVRAARREPVQPALFGDPELDRAKAVDFYHHEMDWVNRLILGDSLVVMTSLVERERLAGQVRMIYLDPPYGINFNSNFQARISDRSPKETSDDSLTREPEQIQAYRDTWQLGIHSYLSYLRTRLVAARDLLTDDGSVFVQIGPDNVHLVRTLMDEVFGRENACTIITVAKTSQVTSRLLPEVQDFLVWYAKDKERVKYSQLFEERSIQPDDAYQYVESPAGERRRMTSEELLNPQALLEAGHRIYTLSDATSQGYSQTKTVEFDFAGRTFHPGRNRHWLLRTEGMEGLARENRLAVIGDTLRYVRYVDDSSGLRRTNIWTDTGQAGYAQRKGSRYIVETNSKIVERCITMTTDPGDLVLDPTIGSGTTAWAAEKHGRRWIGIDTSRVALAVARERLLTAKFDYYQLLDLDRGVDGGLHYRSLKWVTSSSVGYGREPETHVLYDQPLIDRSRVRVSGPFTVEALSRYAEDPFATDGAGLVDASQAAADHVAVLLDALRQNGIPRRDGGPLEVATLAPLAGSDVLHAEGTFREEGGGEQQFAVSLGPRHGAITPLQVDDALREAPGYELIVLAGFAATAEAQEYLAPGKRGRVRVALLEANPDLLLGDLLKQTKASQTFRLFSSPDVALKRVDDGSYTVEVRGMDSFDGANGEVASRGADEIAAWLLDTDYDGAAFHANQAFFTRDNAWEALGKALRGAVDEALLSKLHSLESLPFERPPSGRVAVRVIDDAGSTSERVVEVPA